MPQYNSSTIPFSIAPGDVITVWNAETPAPGNGGASASVQVALAEKEGSPQTPVGIDGKFSGAPGAFEVDVQVAAVDADANYTTPYNGSIIAIDVTNNTFHFDYSGTAKFMRLLMRSRTNNVAITATLTRG